MQSIFFHVSMSQGRLQVRGGGDGARLYLCLLIPGLIPSAADPRLTGILTHGLPRSSLRADLTRASHRARPPLDTFGLLAGDLSCRRRRRRRRLHSTKPTNANTISCSEESPLGPLSTRTLRRRPAFPIRTRRSPYGVVSPPTPRILPQRLPATLSCGASCPLAMLPATLG